MPPSERAKRRDGNFRNTGDHRRSAAPWTMLIGWRVINTSIGASGAVITSDDEDPMCRQTIVPRSEQADQKGSQWSLCRLGSLSLAGFSEKDTAWEPMASTRRTSSAMASGSQIGGMASGMNRPGYVPHHSSMCQSL